jgi:chromosome partitioning protein
MKFVIILNNKGGVGKTTSAVNLAAWTAKLQRRCLLVDLDPSASASIHLGFEKQKDKFKTLCDYLINPDSSLADHIYPADMENLFCLPSEPALHEFYEEMQQEEGVDIFLKRSDFPDKYDLILFDSPPNMGNLALNVLAIADYVLIPVQTQYLALSGLELTLKTIDKAKRHLNSKLKILGFFGTHYDRRTRVALDVYDEIKKRFDSKVFETVIGVNSKLIEAYQARQPILQYAPSARGSKEYRSLTEEVLQRLKI